MVRFCHLKYFVADETAYSTCEQWNTSSIKRDAPFNSIIFVVLAKFVLTGILECPHIRFLLVGVYLVAGYTAAPEKPTATQIQGLPASQHARDTEPAVELEAVVPTCLRNHCNTPCVISSDYCDCWTGREWVAVSSKYAVVLEVRERLALSKRAINIRDIW
jgi:hypothetical protein